MHNIFCIYIYLLSINYMAFSRDYGLIARVRFLNVSNCTSL